MSDSLRSPLKCIVHAPTGRTLRMGRTRPPLPEQRRMFLRSGTYFRSNLPPRPHRTTYAEKAQRCLTQVLMNDQLGCCTFSGAYHIEGTVVANSGRPCPTYSNATITKSYELSGYVPGQPDTDQGWDEVSLLNAWKDGKLDKIGPIAGWLTADAHDPEQMRYLIWLFENLYFGWELPDAWVNADMPSRSGFRWRVAGDPDPSNGHCTVAVDYDDSLTGPLIATWGMTGVVDWDAIAKYGDRSAGGEVHCVVTTAMLERASQKAPNGFDWAQLVADFNARGGNVQPLAHLIA